MMPLTGGNPSTPVPVGRGRRGSLLKHPPIQDTPKATVVQHREPIQPKEQMEHYKFTIPTDRARSFLSVLAESNSHARKYPRHFTQLRPKLISESQGVACFVVRIRDRRKVLFSELLGFIHDANARVPIKRVAGGKVH